MTHLGGSALQGCSRGQPDAHLRGSPVPPGTAQHSQANPLATADLKRQFLAPAIAFSTLEDAARRIPCT